VSQDSVGRAPVSSVLFQREADLARCDAVEAQTAAHFDGRTRIGTSFPAAQLYAAIIHACPVEA
jgi:hypothetical protein